jgi:radical SAM superfamily enzyme YgiQ (UPF0313 family)
MMRFTMVLAEIRSDFPGFSGFYSEGVASLASLIKARHHSFSLVHLTRPQSPSIIAKKISDTAPDVIGYSCMTHTFHYVRKYSESTKLILPRVPSIIGGVHAMLHPDECLESPGIDAVCVGEGEIPMQIFLDRLEKKITWNDIPGIWTKAGENSMRNSCSPVVTELDMLPFPDRSIFSTFRLMTTREGVMYAHASRGCPFDCAFCCNKVLQQTIPASTPSVRLKSVIRMCEEISTSDQYKKGNIFGIYFQDDIFPLSKKWLEEFAIAYPEKIRIPFNCNLRADVVTEERIRLLRSAGCVSVSIGVETGIESLRTSLLNKNIMNAQFEIAFDILRRHGIRINTFSMVGLPGENVEDALETVRFNSHPVINKSLCSIFFPYHGTELYNYCRKEGLLTEKMSDTYQQTTVLHQQSISLQQVEFLHDYFGVLIYLVRRYGGKSAIMSMMYKWITNGDVSLSFMTRLFRIIRKLMIVPYLSVGKYIVNRQKKIFR